MADGLLLNSDGVACGHDSSLAPVHRRADPALSPLDGSEELVGHSVGGGQASAESDEQVDAARSEAAVSSRVASSFKPGFRFALPSSLVTKTPEVIKMREDHAAGRPVAIYEFLQGMVDYGADKTPPPRIRIQYSDGSQANFDGTPAALVDPATGEIRDNIVSIEFFNAGPGLKPEETTIIRHGEGKENSLGEHGRGTSVSLTYLKSEGLDVSVKSNCYGYEWEADADLTPTATGLDQALTVSGSVTRAVSDEEACTVFKVEAGGNKDRFKAFCGELLKASDLFLFANPDFPGACLVDSEVDVEAERARMESEGRFAKIGPGEVMCLDEVLGIPNDDASDPLGFVYVDGIKLDYRYLYHSGCMLPWSFAGLRDAEGYRRVRRSNDSSSVWSADLPWLIGSIVRRLKDKSLLKKLILTGLADDRKYTEFARGDCFDSETRVLVLEIWKEEFQDAVVTQSEDDAARYTSKCADGEAVEVKIIHSNLYSFLRNAGVPGLDTVSKEKRRESAQLYGMTFDFMTSDEPIYGLFEYLIKKSSCDIQFRRGTVEFDGQSYFVLAMPEVIKTPDDFDLSNSGYAGACLRAAGAVNSKSKDGFKFFSLTDEDVHELSISTSEEYGDGANRYRSNIEILSYDGAYRTKYSDFDSGFTYILIPDLDSVLPEPTDVEDVAGFMDRARAYLSELAAKFKRAQRVSAVLNAKVGALDRNAKAAKAVEEITASRRAESERVGSSSFGPSGDNDSFSLSRKPSISNAISLGQQVSSVKSSEEVDFSSDPDARVKTGFYRSTVATRFVYDVAGQTVRCEGDNEWKSIQPKKVKRKKGKDICRHKITNLNGDGVLPVLLGHKVVAYSASGHGADRLQFYRDIRTGAFAARGTVDELVYYTAPDKLFDNNCYVLQQPIAEECELVIDQDSLDADWRGFFTRHPIPFNGVREKDEVGRRIKAAKRVWRKQYRYNADLGLSSQVTADSRDKVMAQVLNARGGICNLSAAGFAALLRSLGIPARVLGGMHVDFYGTGTHAIVEYWNSERWITIDPGQFTFSSGQPMDRSRFAGNIDHSWASHHQSKPPLVMRSGFKALIFAALLGTVGAVAWNFRADIKSHLGIRDHGNPARLLSPDIELLDAEECERACPLVRD